MAVDKYFKDKGECYELIDTYFENVGSQVSLLGRAISEGLVKADVVVFMDNWFEFRGCRIEHDICIAYKIPTLYIESGEVPSIDYKCAGTSNADKDPYMVSIVADPRRSGYGIYHKQSQTLKYKYPTLHEAVSRVMEEGWVLEGANDPKPMKAAKFI